MIMASTSQENLPRHAHISAFLVPIDLPGVSVGSPDKKMGQSGTQIADVILEDVRVPASALLGGTEGNGFRNAMQALDSGRLSVAAASTGYAKRILEYGLQYAMERKAFGETIANFQLIQAMLADSKAEIYASECMLQDATKRADAGERISSQAACVKMFASEMCGRIADRVVQIHGGNGYALEYEASRLLCDARILNIFEGAAEIQAQVVAKRKLAEGN